MQREEFIKWTKTAMAPALKSRRLKSGAVKIFFEKNGQFVIIPKHVFELQPEDTCEAKRQERLAGIFFDLTTNQNKEVKK